MPTVHLKQRDRQTLRLLSWTQATAGLILKASESFVLPDPEEPYRDERRVRERLQSLAQAGLVRSAPVAVPSGGVMNWYRLTVEGFRAAQGGEHPLPPKNFFEPIRISRQEHTVRLAEVIVHTIAAGHASRVEIVDFHRENELKVTGGNREQFPDAFFGLRRSGRRFNVMLELDNGTEPLDSTAPHSIREKIFTYEAHQDQTLGWWFSQGRPRRVNPRFRVVFLTRTAQRAEHIAALAFDLARNKDRLLCYAAAVDDYLSAGDALTRDVFLDHHGRWQALVNVHPSSRSQKAAVRLAA